MERPASGAPPRQEDWEGTTVGPLENAIMSGRVITCATVTFTDSLHPSLQAPKVTFLTGVRFLYNIEVFPSFEEHTSLEMEIL
jgi:hypothetical protein